MTRAPVKRAAVATAVFVAVFLVVQAVVSVFTGDTMSLVVVPALAASLTGRFHARRRDGRPFLPEPFKPLDPRKWSAKRSA
jgi:hypothetical protein